MAIYTVKLGTDPTSTAYNSARKIVRKSNGELWTAYYRSDGTRNQIYCAYSTDNGETWTEEQVTFQTGSYQQTYCSLAVDSEDNLHLVWQGQGWGSNLGWPNIKYCKRTTSWGSVESITDTNAVQGLPVIVIDSEDNIHVAWQGQGWGENSGYDNIQYRKRTTSWQTQEGVTDVAAYQYDPCLAIDSEDNIHATWFGKGWGVNSGYYNIQYRKRTTSWQTQEDVTDVAYDQKDPCLAIDSNDYVHMAWHGKGWETYPALYNIQYRKRTTSWQTREAVTDINAIQINPSLTLDSEDNIHVAWNGLGWGVNSGYNNIQYRKRTTSWQTQEGVTDRAYTNGFPTAMWALSPGSNPNFPVTGIIFIFSGEEAEGVKVECYKSADLAWPYVLENKSANMAAKMMAAGVL